jgi:N-glycosylase/DNA lyase
MWKEGVVPGVPAEKVTGTVIDVTKTFESGAVYHWWEKDGWYETTVGGGFLRVRDEGDGFVYEAEGVPEEEVVRFLGLGDDLGGVADAVEGDPVAEEAFRRQYGLRVPRDDPFASVVSFIASAQSRNERTRGVVRGLCEKHGETGDGWAAHTFPSPEEVASLGEERLRELGFGYRGPYVAETARSIADGDVCPRDLRTAPYTEAHDELKRLKGVGDKVADCVLLFSLGFIGVVALDTWLRRIIDEHYPGLVGGTYEETARAFRDRFGGYGGYVQTVLYHEARTGDLDM